MAEMSWKKKNFSAFGDKEAVSAFDRLGRSIADMACIASGLPSNLVHPVLDDTPVVTPKSSIEGP
jgi:hypothetical protein